MGRPLIGLYVIPHMKPRSRYRLLAVIAVVGGLLSYGAWTGVSDEHPDNQGGVLLALMGLFLLTCVYATSSANWLVGRLRPAASDRPKGSGSEDPPCSRPAAGR